ncbi:class I SAM-dependent methyltransferase [Thiorhodovibrio litoralis]|nr:class I SAM-dependent methyltransferase [Thiorhodovibrio litoralis]
MSPLYEHFLPLIPVSGRILDAGCGSGRDARAFREFGFTVQAFDASHVMANIASQHLQAQVEVLRFQDIDWFECFDGIWACASLLHVPLDQLADALARLSRALKKDGVLYASFKYGRGEREHNGRRFTDLDESGLAELIALAGQLSIVETWITGDLRPGREAERWLNALLRKSP